MKKLLLQVLVTLSVGLAAAASGTAQGSQTYRAHIPFDFTVNDKVMKAGDYRIGPITGLTDQRALRILNLDDNTSRVLGFVTIGTESWDEAGGKLTFARSGGEYTLSNVETPTFGLQLQSRRTNIKVITRLMNEPETVVVALR